MSLDLMIVLPGVDAGGQVSPPASNQMLQETGGDNIISEDGVHDLIQEA